MNESQVQNPARGAKPRVPGTSRALTENWRRYYAMKRFQAREALGGRNPSGLKRMYVPGLEPDAEGFKGVLTPHGFGTMKRRRAARKVAHESRRRNRT